KRFFWRDVSAPRNARTASARTLEDTILFVVDRNNLQTLLAKHQGLADRISQELGDRQESLRNLGLWTEDANEDNNPITWIRRRINAIFSI
ncbi:MAG: hypothetical protein HC919_15605, partial [Oscillatoriales cyanobacterium SM2_2_1]|nr:hypothetical protein [Oscillatoriales cyanobacterium SM2_2_1]